jgi:membrane-associated HD superfamily phosphohydrolase
MSLEEFSTICRLSGLVLICIIYFVSIGKSSEIQWKILYNLLYVLALVATLLIVTAMCGIVREEFNGSYDYYKEHY